jgi:hypothetical protein
MALRGDDLLLSGPAVQLLSDASQLISIPACCTNLQLPPTALVPRDCSVELAVDVVRGESLAVMGEVVLLLLR